MNLVYWHWFALGALLLIVELLAPGMFFLWLAVSAVITGGVLWLSPGMNLELQFIAFGVLAVCSVVASRKYLARHPIETDEPWLNQRTAQYVGRIFTLEHPIIDGYGKIRVDDTTWKIHGEDLAKGRKVRVVAAEGVVLKVIAAD